jgi:hypothetical protein
MGAPSPSPLPPGQNRGRIARYAGMNNAARVEAVWTDLRTWAGEREVFLLGSSSTALQASLPAGAELEVVGEFETADEQALFVGGAGRLSRGRAGGGPGFAPPGAGMPAPGGFEPGMEPGAGRQMPDRSSGTGKTVVARVRFPGGAVAARRPVVP